jgi:hypothetical protein
MRPATSHRPVRALVLARVLLALQALGMAVPAVYLVLATSKDVSSPDKLTAELAKVVAVLGFGLGVVALAVALCAWKLAAGRGVRITTVVLETLIAVVCLPQSLAAYDRPVPFAFPAMVFVATAIALLVVFNLDVSGRR